MANLKSFTQEFIQDKKMIGSIMPSWRFLVKKIVRKINFSKDKVIVVNMSGRGDKDIFTIADAFDDPHWKTFIQEKAEAYHA